MIYYFCDIMGCRTYISCIYVLLLASIFVLLVTMTSCRATKFVGEGEYLLVKNKVKCDNNSIKEEDLMLTLSQKSNKKILGLVPFNLHVYNFMKSGKPRKWKEKLANSIGEEPTIYAIEATNKSIENINAYMASQSYYRSSVSVEEHFNKHKKAKVKYI
ncbi:MAG: hypothetical protein II935_08460 [Bacteroidales bacterium]|nr:hypothetical protein [Bacteroidales bacterium]